MDPVSLSCRHADNCNFCNDKKCGPTQEVVFVRDPSYPIYGIGWYICDKKECQKAFDTNYEHYLVIPKTTVLKTYPHPKIYRSNGEIAKDWIILDDVVRYQKDQDPKIRVGILNTSGSIGLYKDVAYTTFLQWQKDS
jgi:hypothetical protein